MRIIHQILTQQVFNLVFLNATFKKNKMGAIEIPQNARFQCVQIAVITRKIGYHYNTKELVKTKHCMGYYKLVLFQLD